MGSLYKKLDIVLVIATFCLIVFGVVALYSSSHTIPGEGIAKNYFLRQIIFVFLGLVVVVFLYFIPNKWIYDFTYYIYGLSLVFLVLVLFVGKTGMGAERWLRIGSIGFQPSEFAKLATVLMVARYLSSEKVDPNNVKHFIVAAFIIFLPFALIVRQPDLGTALVFVALALPMFYWAGLRIGNLFLIITPIAIIFASFQFYAFLAIMIILTAYLVLSRRSRPVIVLNFLGNVLMGLLTPVLWNNLKPYQQNRIKIFLNPEADPRGAGYQIIQSKVAIGSGGITGKGFMQGSQTQLRFLPEQHTDFIYAVIGEEFGFLGVVFGLLLFFILLIRGVQIAGMVKNVFNSLVAIGIVTLIGFHVMVNIGMTIGLFPVTGLPLPFMSYGGTALLTNMAMVGILLNFYKNRYEY